MKDPYKHIRRETHAPGFKFGSSKYVRDRWQEQQLIAEEMEDLGTKKEEDEKDENLLLLLQGQ